MTALCYRNIWILSRTRHTQTYISFGRFHTAYFESNTSHDITLSLSLARNLNPCFSLFCSFISIMTLQSKVAHAPHEVLPYTVYSHSSHNGPYHPRNICVNDPTEQSSRWSSGFHDQSQYITLQLEKPAVVCKVTLRLVK